MRSFIRKIREQGMRKTLVPRIIKKLLQAQCFIHLHCYSANKPILQHAKIVQPTQFNGDGNISITGAQIGIWPAPILKTASYIEARTKQASITIDKGTIIAGNALFIAEKTKITIGKGCMIGANCYIVDSDFHGLEIANRHNGQYECAPVVIEDDVWIGHDVKILKGVTISQGAVIGAGSIVTKNVPANSIYAGVPAKHISDIDNS